ncbi:MAG: hypothetical protein PSU94_06900 [Lacunisphaera sp.]|nr:hypothetical protein [Lacunisphaera sp.]
MKSFILPFVATLVFSGGLAAGTQDITVTPSTLTDWQVKGADRDKLAAQDTLRLPAGAELTRTFSGGAVVVYTASRPHFGGDSTDWPVVQAGPAALALIRKGVRGEVALLIDDQVSTLPLDVPLDSNGDSLRPVELALGYDPLTKVGVVAFGDQTRSFSGTGAGTGVEVAVAAGEKTPWTHDSLEVLVIGPEIDADLMARADLARATKQAALLQAAVDKLRQFEEWGGGGGGSGAGGSPEKPALAGARLEIYTPPAVRHGAAAVRAVIAQGQKQ